VETQRCKYVQNYFSLLFLLVSGFTFGQSWTDPEVFYTDDNGYYHLEWSPDGQSLAAASFQNNETRLWIIDLREQHANALDLGLSGDMYISWYPNPNVRRVAFDAYDSSDRSQIWTYDLDTEHLEQLTTGGGAKFMPRWSPDGSFLLYHLDGDLYRLDSDTGVVSLFLDSTTPIFHHAWSPEGQELVFSIEQGGNVDIAIYSLVDQTIVPITTHEARDDRACWSPMGDMIAFVSSRSGNEDIWVYNIETAAMTQLTTHEGRDSFPAWSPDGTRLIFMSERDSGSALWETNLNPDIQDLHRFILPHFTIRENLWSTRLSIMPAADFPLELLFIAFDNNGRRLSWQKKALPAESGFSQTMDEIFPILDGDVGWLEIRSSMPDIAGLMTFTFQSTRATSSLPIHSEMGGTLLLPFIQNDPYWASGLAICNPNDQIAEIEIELLDLSGHEVGSVTLGLGPNSKYVDMVTNLFSNALPEVSQMRINSNLPLQAFALSFSEGNTQIVAVPATLFDLSTIEY